MRTDEILAAHPSSVLIQLIDPYKRKCRFVREDEYGEHYCDPPSDWRAKFSHADYRSIVRRKMGREVIA